MSEGWNSMLRSKDPPSEVQAEVNDDELFDAGLEEVEVEVDLEDQPWQLGVAEACEWTRTRRVEYERLRQMSRKMTQHGATERL